jgi:hemoglobin
MKKYVIAINLAAAFLVMAALGSFDAVKAQYETKSKTQASSSTQASLYERLGGVYAISAVVDDFLDRLYVNDVLNANPAIKEARIRVPRAGLKYQVTALVCQSCGGPEKYTGRTMKESHKNLNITESEWQAMVSDFQNSLNKFKVPDKEQKELFAIVESTKGDIVVAVR